MKISGIEIIDTFGCKQFKVGSFTALRILGANGSGKSSILRALGYLFGGGTDPSVIRKGAEQSVICMTLDDGTKISKVTRPKRSRKGGEITGYTVDLEIVQPDGTPRGAPQSYIAELSKDLAIDPSILLRIDATTVPGRRALAAELMKLIEISFAPEEIAAACSYRSNVDVPRESPDALALSAPPPEPLTLDDLKKLSAAVTEQRRREGQVKQDTDGAINRLQKALPESTLGHGEQYAAGKSAEQRDAAMRKELDDAEEFRRQVEKAIADAKLEAEQRKGKDLATNAEVHSKAVQEINADIDARIKALEAERIGRTKKADARRDEAKEYIEQTAKAEADAIDAEAAPQLAAAIESVTQAKDRIAAHARAATLREEIEVQLTAHRAASWKYDQLSEVLQRLESMRVEKLKNLPVPGLVVEDGVPMLDGIEWQNVNLARRVEAILQICCMQTGKLPLILWDDCEHADNETLRAIERGLIDAGYQVIEARVSDSPLTIEEVQVAA